MNSTKIEKTLNDASDSARDLKTLVPEIKNEIEKTRPWLSQQILGSPEQSSNMRDVADCKLYYFVSKLDAAVSLLNLTFSDLHIAATIPKVSKLDSALQYCDVKPAIEKEFP